MPAAAVLALLALTALPAAGELPARSPSAESPPDRPLVVGTKEAPPFVIRQPDGSYSGISIELWEELALELGLQYELRELGLNELIAEVKAGRLDAAVAALTVTAPREEVLDFTHPFYTSGLAIAVVPRQQEAWLDLAGRLVALDFLKAVGALALLLMAIGALVWLLERRRNPGQFGGGALEGLGSGFWWSAVTMTTVGYGDKAPVTPAGRLVALLWMFASIILISGFTAAIASSLTVASLGSPVEGPKDLPRVRVAAPAGSTSEAYLRHHRVPMREMEDVHAALEVLSQGEVEAVVYDEPIVRYLVSQGAGGAIRVLPETFERQSYAIALPAGSPLREPLNRALLRRIRGPEWQQLLARYLGE